MIANCFSYRGGERLHEGPMTVEEAAAARKEHDFVWLEVVDPEKEEIQALAERFELPELAVEDAYKASQRPKVEQHGSTLFIVLRTLQRAQTDSGIETGELHLFMENDFVIVVRHRGDPRDFEEIRRRVESRPELLKVGPSVVVHAAIDEVVDDYEPVIDDLSDEIDEIEKQVFSEHPTGSTRRIFRAVDDVVEVRRATASLVTPLERLYEGRYEDIPEEMQPYFRDVYDHVQRANEQVEGFRDLLAGLLEVTTAIVTLQQNEIVLRQNDIVRKISGWAAIIAVPTLISGIYGMNFNDMPELRWSVGYPFALLLMLSLATGVYLLLKRADWL